ncbi:MAG TPA: TonB-dependent receptor [Gemmatimonadales bacterium]|nr:TonB-dependent receptor [Gemmatimonadales bacterium]
MQIHAGALVALVLVGTTSLLAQDQPQRAQRDTAIELPPMTVTATRDPREVFRTPAPVSVVDSTTLARRAPASITDLFFDLPGLDVNGVGPSQSRPIIRGLLGERILLLEDGIRMNNSRRESDFGEIPSLVGLEGLGQVEVVRGPASVLYGTDAIGGAINLITRQPPQALGQTALHGSFGYRYQGAGDQQRPYGLISGTAGRFSFLAYGAYRDASDYTAPPGNFGTDTLRYGTRVHDTGVKDQNYAAQLGYALGENQGLKLRYERYTSDNAGFGWVASADLGQPFNPDIIIRYPNQGVDKVSLGYTNRALGSALADRVDVTTYFVSNSRHLDFDLLIPTGPGSSGTVAANNFTDIDTYGLRVEAAKAVGKVLLTYGVDGFEDRTTNTDTTITTGLGPTTVDPVTKTPNALFRSVGAFLQSDFHFGQKLNLIAGVRVQDIKAETRLTPTVTTPLVSHDNATVVGSLNAEYFVTENVSLIGSVGRGFRSPNLIERFFNGPTPEGSGFEVQSPNLKPETSINLDAGFRLRGRPGSLEVFGFRNEISDAITLVPNGDSVQGVPAFTNVNIDKLRYLGLEANGHLILGYGFSSVANFTVFDSKDVLNPSNPVAQTYGLRLAGELRYDHPNGRFWLAYGARHNGRQKDITTTPLPNFTVMQARAGAILFRAGRSQHMVMLTLDNVANKLYSEASNSNFFRPNPGRNVTAAYRVDF